MCSLQDDLLGVLGQLPQGTKYRLVAGNTSGVTPDFGENFCIQRLVQYCQCIGQASEGPASDPSFIDLT